MRRASPRSCFEALTASARRRNIDVKVIETNRTLVAEFSDTKFLEPFVGTHRIQRIPKGSPSRHTSTATVAILDLSESEFVLHEGDLIERFARGSGPGGQHRNKTSSTVVLTHVPSGIEVRVDGRSQWQNRQDARTELARRLSEEFSQNNCSALNRKRNEQIAGRPNEVLDLAPGNRAAKGFTYNTQRDEVVDHSTGKKWRMSSFMKGKF